MTMATTKAAPQVAASPAGLEVRDLAKIFPGGHGKALFRNLSFDVAFGEHLALLGRNGQGKSTLLKILGGIVPIEEGRINWNMSPSWPLGFGGGFQGSLSGLDNIRFHARIYDKPFNDLLAQVDDFAELGAALRQPVKHYSSGMRARLAFGLSIAIEFDCYMIDEVVAVGDARFSAKCHDELFVGRGERSFIIASHDMSLIRQTCTKAAVIEGGNVKFFDDVEHAIDIYTWLRTP